MNTSDAMVRGLAPYRLGIQSMHLLQGKDGPLEQRLHGLRAHFDPRGIIAPGCYVD